MGVDSESLIVNLGVILSSLILVILPLLSTVICGILVASPYSPADPAPKVTVGKRSEDRLPEVILAALKLGILSESNASVVILVALKLGILSEDSWSVVILLALKFGMLLAVSSPFTSPAETVPLKALAVKVLVLAL